MSEKRTHYQISSIISNDSCKEPPLKKYRTGASLSQSLPKDDTLERAVAAYLDSNLMACLELCNSVVSNHDPRISWIAYYLLCTLCSHQPSLFPLENRCNRAQNFLEQCWKFPHLKAQYNNASACTKVLIACSFLDLPLAVAPSELFKTSAMEYLSVVRNGAVAGFPFAQYYLGCIKAQGKLCERNEEEAVQLFRLASQQGHISATFRLGIFYLAGMQGVEKDEWHAYSLIHQAALQGQADAQYFLGHHYKEDNNASKALHFFHLAASQGHAEAEILLR